MFIGSASREEVAREDHFVYSRDVRPRSRHPGKFAEAPRFAMSGEFTRKSAVKRQEIAQASPYSDGDAGSLDARMRHGF